MTGDNALAESKNGTVIRHQLGRAHIPRRHRARVNHFTRNVLSPFLNYHRPCHFPVEIVGEDGRARSTPPGPNCSASSRGTGRRPRDPNLVSSKSLAGMGTRLVRSPRFPPPAHRRFTV